MEALLLGFPEDPLPGWTSMLFLRRPFENGLDVDDFALRDGFWIKGIGTVTRGA